LKKFLIIGVVIALVVTLIPGAVLAADPTVVNVNWTGAGVVNTTFTAGNDAVHTLAVNAGTTTGAFNARDENDNPYTYNVDTTSSNANLSLSGGSATYTVARTDSKTSMYGPAGQNTFSFIGVNPDGTAEMGMCTKSNYAFLQQANYGKPEGWVNGVQFKANSPTAFQIIHQVTNSEGDTAWFDSQGTGTAEISCMSSDIYSGSLKFGKGAGCYTKADFNGTGTQSLEFFSQGHSSVSQFGFTVPGDGTAGSATLNTLIGFSGTFSTPNPSTGPGFSADVN
jgi:hypothetical protein